MLQTKLLLSLLLCLCLSSVSETLDQERFNLSSINKSIAKSNSSDSVSLIDEAIKNTTLKKIKDLGYLSEDTIKIHEWKNNMCFWKASQNGSCGYYNLNRSRCQLQDEQCSSEDYICLAKTTYCFYSKSLANEAGIFKEKFDDFQYFASCLVAPFVITYILIAVSLYIVWKKDKQLKKMLHDCPVSDKMPTQVEEDANTQDEVLVPRV